MSNLIMSETVLNWIDGTEVTALNNETFETNIRFYNVGETTPVIETSTNNITGRWSAQIRERLYDMKIEFEREDLQTIANEFAELVLEKIEDNHRAPLVDKKGLCAYLNVKKSWIDSKVRDTSKGSIPRVQVGKYVRFDIDEVMEWLKRQ